MPTTPKNTVNATVAAISWGRIDSMYRSLGVGASSLTIRVPRPGEVNAPPKPPETPAIVVSSRALSSPGHRFEAIHDPRPPPIMIRANDGPRLAPATAETAARRTHDGATLWSTTPDSITATPPGTSSVIFSQLRIAAATSPPAAMNGIHHQSPDHVSIRGSPKIRSVNPPVIPR